MTARRIQNAAVDLIAPPQQQGLKPLLRCLGKVARMGDLIAPPQQQGLKLKATFRSRSIFHGRDLIAPPQQQGLKHSGSSGPTSGLRDLIAPPQQQGLKPYGDFSGLGIGT